MTQGKRKAGTRVKDRNTEEKLLFWTVAGPVATLMIVVGGLAVTAGSVLAWLLSRSRSAVSD